MICILYYIIQMVTNNTYVDYNMYNDHVCVCADKSPYFGVIPICGLL